MDVRLSFSESVNTPPYLVAAGLVSAVLMAADGSALSLGAGAAIDGTVTDGIPQCVLFVNADGALAQSEQFTFLGNILYIGDPTYVSPLVGISSTQISIFNSGGANEYNQLEYNRIDIGNANHYVELLMEAASAQLNLDGGVIFNADGTTLEIIDLLKLNNVVAAGVGLASTHKMSLNIGGTDYYVPLVAA